MRLLIVVATYNELDNLPALVDRLVELLPSVEIVVVDDDSPDGTWKWVQKKAEVLPSLKLIHRTKERGLGSATIAGLKFGLDDDFDFIGTMDADFSHDPAAICEMFELAQSGSFDAVVGSRYVRGGRIEGWPLHRRLASRVVNLLARYWLGLKTHDNTGALRVYRAEILRKVGLSDIRSAGYAYLEELMMKLQRNKAVVIEHPITFRDREEGRSKAGLGVGIAVIREILMMRFQK